MGSIKVKQQFENEYLITIDYDDKKKRHEEVFTTDGKTKVETWQQISDRILAIGEELGL